MARVMVLKPKGMCFMLTECNELQDFYDELECDVFDIARRKVGDKYFDIFVDDMGLFSEDPVISAWDKDGKPMLVGNLVFANHDGQGNTTGLTDDDVITICSNVAPYIKGKDKFLSVICDY